MLERGPRQNRVADGQRPARNVGRLRRLEMRRSLRTRRGRGRRKRDDDPEEPQRVRPGRGYPEPHATEQGQAAPEGEG